MRAQSHERREQGCGPKRPGWCRALIVTFAVCATSSAFADRATEIARIHVEALGGPARIAALSALRMTGVVVTETRRVPVTLIAARPARLRVESRLGDHTVIQAADGMGRPWQTNVGDTPPTFATMGAEPAERFMADAEFDDPLVHWEELRDRLDFVGERDVGGRKLLAVLVARIRGGNIVLLLDPKTYFIALRVQEIARSGARVELVTRYDDYRPVGGVLVAHRVTLFEDGKFLQEARFELVEANPQVSDDAFVLPSDRGAPAGATGSAGG